MECFWRVEIHSAGEHHSPQILSEQKANSGAIIDGMAGSRCRVSFTDSEGVLHGVDVDAGSLYEAVAIAVAQLRDDDISPTFPGPMTEFTVAVYRNPTEHRIRLSQVSKWAEHTTRDGPAGITKRQRVRTLLGEKA
jgi:hypothetical protein